MTPEEVFESMHDVFKAVFSNNGILITRETTARDVDGWDSFAHMNLIVALEKKFGIKFRLTELQELKSVGDMMDFIEKKVNAGA